MVGEQLHQRIAEALPEAALDKSAATLATKQQALRFEALNRLTQRGTGDVELFCQFAFRWEFFARAESAFEDQKLQLLLNHIGEFWLADFAVGHEFLS
ncbi:hypothetical protein HMPREF1601_03257 [Escherichia coli 907779]|nr:hypothetical protein HMPREF1601_03257 [Escherichia coli 907779]ESD14701.1 hypothetical protein HMPREF1596_01247 [Escherichia coli 907700]ESD28706.1 hypothetical protein HMPREF1597_00005 [Escherichia coli 907701]ESE10015.1 hypothetical protein HMPREF1615_01001 [Escherichia coli 908632]